MQDQRDAEQLPADERLHDDDDAAGIADAVDLDAAQQTLLSDEVIPRNTACTAAASHTQESHDLCSVPGRRRRSWICVMWT